MVLSWWMSSMPSCLDRIGGGKDQIGFVAQDVRASAALGETMCKTKILDGRDLMALDCQNKISPWCFRVRHSPARPHGRPPSLPRCASQVVLALLLRCTSCTLHFVLCPFESETPALQ